MRDEAGLAEFKRNLDEALAGHKRAQQEAQQSRRVSDTAHIKAAINAKIDPDLNPEDASKAKQYSRGRAFMMLRKSYDTLEEALNSENAKLAQRVQVALCTIQRAVGPPEIPNSVKADLDQYGSGRCH